MSDILHNDIERILLSSDEIKSIVKQVAEKINNDYIGEELTAIVILRGSVIFASDLIRELKMPVKVDFMQASSYGAGAESSGFIQIKYDTTDDLEGKNILIIEDIVDSGNTLSKLKELLSSRNPKNCKICTLLDKPERRTTEIYVDYVGTTIPNEFAVGYGLDYNENYRNLPYIGVLKREIYE